MGGSAVRPPPQSTCATDRTASLDAAEVDALLDHVERTLVKSE